MAQTCPFCGSPMLWSEEEAAYYCEPCDWYDDEFEDAGDLVDAFVAAHPGLGASPTEDDLDDYLATNGGAHFPEDWDA